MRFSNTIFCLFISIFFFNASFSQEQLGLRLENYSGVNSLSLNPANNLSSKFSWDVNLVGAGLFGESNYGFIYNTNIPEILRLLPEVDAAFNYSSENQYPDNTLIVDFKDNNRKKYFNGIATILGPSFMVNLESGHSFGIFTSFRTAVSAQQVPPELSYAFFDRTPFREVFEVAPSIAGGLVWGEIGINYGRRIETNTGNLDIGASIKFLNGYEAFFMNNTKAYNLSQISDDTLSFSAPNFEYGLTTSNASGDDFSLNRNGGGIAFDLGAVITIDGYEGEYKWKFGAALLDIGKIKFSKNAQSHVVDTDQTFLVSTQDYDGQTDVEELIKTFSEQALGDPDLSLKERSFDIWLPGALSLQADYQVLPYIFVNTTLIQRLPYKRNAVKRGNLIALTPRFEHRWFSGALPISVYNYNKLRLGASIRIAFLTIGTENLSSFIGQSNFEGSDIYFAFKINPFDLGLNLGGGGRGGKQVRCYDF